MKTYFFPPDVSKAFNNLAFACQPVIEHMRDIGNIINELNEDPEFQKLVGSIKLKQMIKRENIVAIKEMSDNHFMIIGISETALFDLETGKITVMKNQDLLD